MATFIISFSFLNFLLFQVKTSAVHTNVASKEISEDTCVDKGTFLCASLPHFSSPFYLLNILFLFTSHILLLYYCCLLYTLNKDLGCLIHYQCLAQTLLYSMCWKNISYINKEMTSLNALWDDMLFSVIYLHIKGKHEFHSLVPNPENDNKLKNSSSLITLIHQYCHYHQWMDQNPSRIYLLFLLLLYPRLMGTII